MPVYNEAECIEAVVRAWIAELARSCANSFSMIVVNDGSKDETGRILDRLATEDPRIRVVHQANAGHGAALLRGYNEAVKSGSAYVFQVDSDDQFEPSDFARLWEKRAESKFILGYREVRHDALHRLIITRIMKTVLFFFFGAWIGDANIPYRLIETAYLGRLLEALPKSVFAPNIFLSVLASKEGQDLKSIPVSHRDRRTGTVSIVRWTLIRACLRCLRELFAFRISLGTKVSTLRGERTSP
jgi:glycosyltransferase involved in cell wall biosynthesis